MNVEEAFKIATSIAKMKAETVHLDRELAATDASVTQRRMVTNINHILSALENSLRPLLPDDETAAGA